MRLLPKGGAARSRGQVLLRGENILARIAARIARDPRQQDLDDPAGSADLAQSGVHYRRPAARGYLPSHPRAEAATSCARPSGRCVMSTSPRRSSGIGQYPHQMSGGMKQRVVGAIAISGHPEVLIADEPTTALDVTIQLQYLKLLKRLQQESGMAILFITHDFGVVARMCDRVAVMYAGRIVECGPVRQVFEYPSHPYTQALIASVPKITGAIERLTTIEGQPPSLHGLARRMPLRVTLPLCGQTLPRGLSGQLRRRRGAYRRLLEARAQHDRRTIAACRTPAQALPLHQGHATRQRTLGQVKAVDDVSFTIDAGETLGLVGESGCGKTTTSTSDPQSGSSQRAARCCCRASRFMASRVTRCAIIAPKVQAVFQDPWSSLNPRMTVGRTIAEVTDRYRVGRAARIARRVGELLRQVGLRPEQATQYPHEFSGGQRQRIALGRRAGLRTAADRAGRAGLGPRRVDSRADDEPAEGHPGARQCRLPAGCA